MTVLVLLAVAALVGLAIRFGSDSRDGRDWAATPVAPRWTGDILSH